MEVSGGSLTDVAGLRVGHFTDPRRPTGCTVVLADGGAVAGVDVRGAAPGTRETELLSPLNAVEQVHAILLAGGSAFGLDAAGGVMRWLDERGIGVEVGAVTVPIVPAAILFDRWVGDPRIRPDAAAGYAACDAATSLPPAEGSVGVGAGAAVGKLFGIDRAMKGGVGTASIRVAGVTVAALVAVNAVGDVVDPRTGALVAGARTADGRHLLGSTDALLRGDIPAAFQAGGATTIGVVATDAVLTKAQAGKLAQMAHDGLARSINPVHTQSDGDTLFALATGRSGLTPHLTLLGIAAAEVTALAVLRAVMLAESVHGPGLPDLPSVRDLLR
jgi:L-aminopeptidase/D-esterase-like protein